MSVHLCCNILQFPDFYISAFDFSTPEEELSELKGITKRALHTLSGQRLVMMPEAVHMIDNLDLVLCSDSISHISLAQCNAWKSRSEKAHSNDLIPMYRRRKKDLDLSLSDYFYQRYCQAKGSNKYHHILMAQGLNCKAVYPADFNYARGMLYLHKPWNGNDTLDHLWKNKDLTIQTFLKILPTLPGSVRYQYELARKYSQEAKIECIAKHGIISAGDVNEEDLDEDERQEYLEHIHISNKTDKQQCDDLIGKYKIDIGRDYDWTTKTFHEERDLTADGRDYVNNLQQAYYNQDGDCSVHLPKKKDGSEYEVEHLTQEQKVIVYGALDAIVKFLRKDKDYRPFRATVLGGGGTGKSFIVNTLIAIIRKYTQCNDAIKVAAPSGGAAYNVQGCTLHRLLGVPVDQSWKPLPEKTKKILREQLKSLLALVIDERSMIDSKLISAAEKNLRSCAFGGQKSAQYWGGVPVVILFGDDYQLPPVGNQGAIYGYARQSSTDPDNETAETKQLKNAQLAKQHGDLIFTKYMVENVFVLTENMRVSSHLSEFRDALGRLRTGNPLESSTNDSDDGDDTKWCNLKLSNYNDEFVSDLESRDETAWIFSTKERRNKKNIEKLRDTSRRHNVPVARINCHYESNRNGGLGPFKNHFAYVKNFARSTDICQHSIVAIDGVNFIPEFGLYNGAKGKVIEIVFDKPEGPNDKQHRHLPEYVVVDFPQLNLPSEYEPWDRNHKTVSCVLHDRRMHDCNYVFCITFPTPSHLCISFPSPHDSMFRFQ